MPLPAKDMPPTRVKLLRPSEIIASRKAWFPRWGSSRRICRVYADKIIYM